MRTSLVLLLLCVGCVDRAKSDDGGETAETGTDDASDPTEVDPSNPTDSTTREPPTEEPTTGELDNPAGFCEPINFGAGDCPASYQCCSDDPASTQGRLPNYFSGKEDATFGVPIFSADNNQLSFSGQCVQTGGFPSPFASGCPVACDPTWAADQRELICGAGAVCCPFRQLDPEKDCVIDPQTSLWRAVHGSDIPDLTTWGEMHATNQDPQGASCTVFASDADGAVDAAKLADCYAQLSVADRRGFCFATCPCFEDLCAQKNPGYVPRCADGA